MNELELTQRVNELTNKVALLERQVGFLLRHLNLMYVDLKGASDEPAWMAQVRELANRNRMIDAIKLYRENTGAGLAEAKRAVESLPRG
jgi:ribosomal protein L7/L12